MLYCLENQFGEPIKSYHWSLVEEIAGRFPALTWTNEQKLAAHFTLKYRFETERIAEVEAVIDDFVKNHIPTPVTVGGFDHFNNETVFVKIGASTLSRQSFKELIQLLQSLPWLQWSQYDGEDLHFHMTIAEKCNGTAPEVLQFIKTREKTFAANFDNVTILQLINKNANGMEFWKTYKKFILT